MSKHLVLSDLHFGTPQTSLNDQRVVSGLGEYMIKNGPWDSIIFSGDLLDLNLSIFKFAIEGCKTGIPRICGFRDFITGLYKQTLSSGQRISVGKWVYVPGNHDYAIWNLQSTKEVCIDMLADGKILKPGPKMEGRWEGKDAFVSGVFPSDVREQVSVEYPDHSIPFGKNGGSIVVTHGHYLDFKQTFMNHLNALTSSQKKNSTARSIFIETAQYQALAQAVSYTPGKRNFFDKLFGPENPLSVLQFFAHKVFKSPLRGEAISNEMLEAIELYLGCFRQYDPIPEYFIFGHTHSPGKANTVNIGNSRSYPSSDIEVINAGSFFPEGETAGSFVTVTISEENRPFIEINAINQSGEITSCYK